MPSELKPYNRLQSGSLLHVLPAERDAVRSGDRRGTLVLQGGGQERQLQPDVRAVGTGSLGPARQF